MSDERDLSLYSVSTVLLTPPLFWPRSEQGGEQEQMEQPAAAEDERLAPLLNLVDRLRGEVTDLNGRWNALGEELEAKRGRLRLAEATMELMQRQEDEAAPERVEVTELQGRWEALGEELEAKRGRLRLAEATMELMQRREEEAAPEARGAFSGRAFARIA
jgi:chromosome segregation ATPase